MVILHVVELNAPESMFVTLIGINKSIHVEFPANADEPMLVTLDGTEYDVLVFPVGYCIKIVLLISNNTPDESEV